MIRVALRSLLAHKLRMALTGFAIVMGVGFVAGTYIFTDSINSTFSNLFSDVYQGIDLTVRPVEAEFGFDESNSFSDDILQTVQQTEGVRLAIPEVNGYAQFIDADGNPVGGTGPPSLGFSWVDQPELNVLSISEGNGRPPTATGEVVVDVSTATQNSFRIGDSVAIQTLGPVETFTIVGLATFGEADSLAGATLAIFDLAEAQRLFDLQGQYSAISIKIAESSELTSVQADLTRNLNSTTIEVVTGEQQTQEQQDDINQALGFINIALLSFASIAVFVGAFIIQNTFRIIIAQRSKELALLRAVGATRRQVIGLVLYEAIAVGLIASGLGIVAGIGVANAIRGLGNSVGLGLPEGTLAVLPRTYIVALSVGVVVTALSALLPAIKASRVSPVEALRDNEADNSQRSLRKRSIMSSIITALGVGLLSLGLFGSVASPVYYVGFGAFLMFVGVSAFAPLLSKVLPIILGYPFAKLRGMAGKLAQENTKRTPRRTASTAAALMIGVSLVVLVSVFASSVNATIEDVVADSFPADVIALPQGIQGPNSIIPGDFAAELDSLDELDAVAAIRYDEALVEGDIQFIAGSNPEAFQEVITLDPSDGAYQNLVGDSAIVRSTFLEDKGWELNQAITVDFGDGVERQITIVGTYAKDFDTKLIFNRTLLSEAGIGLQDTFVSANYNSRFSAEEARAAVETIAERYPTVSVQDQDELVQQSKDQINQILGLFWGLLGFAILIAVLGITNTLALSIAERTRELGLLRAVGMTRRQVRTMVRAESIIISLFGATLGILMGIFFSWALLQALESEGLTSFVIPFGQIVTYYILAAIAGIMASVWPAISASRINVLDALDFE